MGEPLFLCQPPTGYSDKSETWVNTGALLNRLNFALAFAGDKMGGATVDLNAMLGEDASRRPRTPRLAQSIQIFLDGQIAAIDAAKPRRPPERSANSAGAVWTIR